MSRTVLSFNCQLQRPGFRLDASGTLQPGVTALFGGSGCGKTTLLRCLAGLERTSVGQIEHDSGVWQSGRVHVPVYQRRVGLVFQDTRLFSHLRVRQNLAYGEQRRTGDGPSRSEVLDTLGLDDLLDRWPDSLSGGEAQRVALGRALLAGPRVLLLDEPLAALDYGRRRRIMPLIRAIPRRFGIPCLYVTHARNEVLELADRVMLMDDGCITAHDRVDVVFSSPAHWLALGDMEPTAIWEGRVVARDNDWGLTTLATDAGRLRLPALSVQRGDRVRLRVSASHVVVLDDPPTASGVLNAMPVMVKSIVTEANEALRLELQAGSRACLWTQVHRQSAAALQLEPGRRLQALVKPQVIGVTD